MNKKKKSTEELLDILKNKHDTLSEYLEENNNQFINDNISSILNKILLDKHLEKRTVIKKSGLNSNYAYQLFNGKKNNPSRNMIICLCIGMNLTLEETQKVLKECKFSVLYPKIERDSIIIYGICHKKSIIDLNILLQDNNQELLN